MSNGAQGIQSSGAAPIWAKAEERKDIDVPNYQQELKQGNAFDFAKKHPNMEHALTGGATIW